MHFARGEVQTVKCSGETIGTVAYPGVFLVYPGMLETLVDGDALFHIHGQHAVDQVERWIADVVPVRGGVVETAGFDLIGEAVGIFFGVEFVAEGWETAEADVEDDTEGPDVDGACVFAVAGVLQNFRSDICDG